MRALHSPCTHASHAAAAHSCDDHLPSFDDAGEGGGCQGEDGGALALADSSGTAPGWLQDLRASDSSGGGGDSVSTQEEGAGAAVDADPYMDARSLRRRDFLLRVFADQYGAANVVYRGPGAAAVAASLQPSCVRAAEYRAVGASEPATLAAEGEESKAAAAEGGSGAVPAPEADPSAAAAAGSALTAVPPLRPAPLCAIDVLVDGSVARVELCPEAPHPDPEAPPRAAAAAVWRVAEAGGAGGAESEAAAGGAAWLQAYGEACAAALGVCRPQPTAAAAAADAASAWCYALPPAPPPPPPPPLSKGEGGDTELTADAGAAEAGEAGGGAEEGAPGVQLIPLRAADAKVLASLARCVALADALFAPII